MIRNISLYIEAVWIAVKDRIPAVRPLIEQVLKDLEKK